MEYLHLTKCEHNRRTHPKDRQPSNHPRRQERTSNGKIQALVVDIAMIQMKK